MWKLFLTIGMALVVASYFFACQKNDSRLQLPTQSVKATRAMGRALPPDSLAKPRRIEIDEKQLTIVKAGNPKSVSANQHVYLAGTANEIPVNKSGLLRIVPGLDGIPLPQVISAKGLVVPVGTPEVLVAKDRVSKDQNPHNFSSFGKLQGLKYNVIRSIHQDKSGSLWIGTVGGGVSKYDGKYFTHYTEKEGLVNNSVLAVLEDQNGDLWFGTEGGISKFNGRTFTHFTEQEGLPPNNEVRCILKDRAGNLWFGMNGGGVGKYDGETFTLFTEREGLCGNAIFSIREDRAGNLWFGARGGGLCMYDGNSFTQFTAKSGLPNGNIESILEDRAGNLWLGTNGGGVLKYDGDKFFQFNIAQGLSSNVVYNILEDRAGNLWFGTHGGGVMKYDGRFFFHFKEKQGLNHNTVSSMMEDSDGNIWLGTDGGGLNLYQGRQFTHYTEAEGLSNSSVFSILQDKNKHLWFATFGGGAIRFDGDSYFQYSTAQGLHANDLYSVIEDKKGNLWFGSVNGGVSKFDGRHFIHYTERSGFGNSGILFILEDSNGNLWFGARGGGAIKFEPDENGHGGRLTYFGKAEGLTHNVVFSILEDKHGDIWFGSGGGLTKLTVNGDDETAPYTFTHYTEDDGLHHNVILSMLEDRRGNLWFGAFGGGIARYDGNTFLHITEKEGLSNDFVLSMLEDNDGNLWFGARFGLSKLSQANVDSIDRFLNIAKNAVLFKNYSYEDGFLGIGCWRNSILQADDAIIYIGANDRLTAYHPESIPSDAHPFTLRPTGVALFNESIPWAQLENSKDSSIILSNGVRVGHFRFNGLSDWNNLPQDLSLRYNNNYLSFEFIGIDLQQPRKVLYQYRLEGLHENWSALNAKNEAHFGNLPPGAYTFQVRARNGMGVWSDEFHYSFTIRPPWWKTWWMYSIYILVGFGALYFIRRMELRKQEQRLFLEQQKTEQEQRVNEQLRRVDALKDQFLANTSHELRTPLQGIIGLSQSLFESESDPEKKENLAMIISSGRRLNVLVDDILDFSKLKNHEIELSLKPVSLHALADVVLRILSPLTLNKKLRLINDVPLDLQPALGDENRLQQIFYNLAGNAVKFTHEGHVRIGAYPNEDAPNMLTCFVEDTGIGIPADQNESIFQEFKQVDGSDARYFAGTGLGLPISKRLVELHGGRIWFESQVGVGSTFFCSLPVSIAAPAGVGAPSPPRVAHVRLAKVVDGQTFADLQKTDPTPAGLPGANTAHDSASEKIHILVVDDEPVNQQVLKNYLSKNTYHLTQAMNGDEALRAIHSGETFDLVLLDIMMPRLSGYEVCQKIREKFLPSELPVIMITAKNQVIDLVQGLNAGANDYISKPFYKEEFLARLNVHLNLHQINMATRRFVPNEFILALGRESITGVRLGDHVEVEVTVLFADIRDYTGLSEQMTPEDNFLFVYSFNQLLGPIIQKNKGFINQYLGDGFMAIFTGNPADALHAAIEIQHEVARYNIRRESKNRRRIEIGVGLHTGPLIMGIIGDESRFDAATISDTVNTASRMEGLTKQYHAHIILSEPCLNTMPVNEGFHFRYLGKTRIKGKQAPTDIYECLSGYSPEAQEIKLRTLDFFTAGLCHYLHQDFEKAVQSLQEVVNANPEDKTAQLFLDRALQSSVSGIIEE